MTSKYSGGRHICAGLVAAIGIVGMTISPAIAQRAAEQEIEEIVLEAPITRSHFTQERGGGWVEAIELSRRVNFADLDLNKHKDVTELEMRIEAIAKETCEKLDEMFPMTVPSGREAIDSCTRSAIQGAKTQLLAAIATAN